MARAVPLFCVFGFAIFLVSSLPTFGDEPESNKPSSSRFVLSEQQKNELAASWDGKLNARVPKVVRYVFENANAIEIFSLDPRHFVYLLICFSCNQVMVCVDDEIKCDLWFMIENWPHVLFNKVCSDEGLPLSESNLAVIEHFYKISPIDDDGKSPVDGDGP
jgi:hypothetical protein